MAPDRNAPNDSDDELAMLRGFEAEPSADLPGRVRRSIERRRLGLDLISCYWTTAARLIAEWLFVLFDRGGRSPSSKREER